MSHGRCGHQFGQPIGAGEMIGPGQAGDAAERLDRVDDALVVGGHHHGVDRRQGGAPVDVLDHRPAVDLGERFTGKAGGVEPGRDDGDDRRLRQSGRQSAWNSGHGE